MPTLDLTYSAAQNHIFFESESLGRFRFFPKGRRLGATRGAAQAFVEWMLDGDACLWGDTINGNIDRYVERYFEPILRHARLPWSWNVQKRLLKVGTGFTDFRSADNPANWEGFGYRKVFLNEAGLILADRYLYENAVLPMLLDFPDSTLVASGTPKGKNLFHELYQRGARGEPGYHARAFTTFDNAFLPQESIRAFVSTYPEGAVRDQEIYARFVDGDDAGFKVIPRAWVDAAVARWLKREVPAGRPDALGVDPARGGRDRTAIAARWGDYVGRLVTAAGTLTPDGLSVAQLVLPLAGPATLINVDVIGVGSSPYDSLRERHARTSPINGAASSDRPKAADVRAREGEPFEFSFVNLRAEMYWRVRELLDPAAGATLALPPDDELAEELSEPYFKLTRQGVQVEAKDDVAARLGRSPDRADAVVYAVHQPPPPRELRRPPSGGFVTR